jgi:hypothetical protein
MNRSSSLAVDARIWFFFGLVALSAVGCGGSGGSEVVQGIVTLDGAPLPATSLTLAPADPQVKGPFTGKTDDQGRFSIGPIGDPNGGVPAGSYQLALTTTRGDDAGMENAIAPPERVPRGAQVRDLEVPSGGLPDLRLELSSEKK